MGLPLPANLLGQTLKGLNGQSSTDGVKTQGRPMYGLFELEARIDLPNICLLLILLQRQTCLDSNEGKVQR